MFGEALSERRAIDVPPDRAQGLPLFQLVGHGGIADIAGMPDLVALGEVLPYPWVDPAMGIADQADPAG